MNEKNKPLAIISGGTGYLGSAVASCLKEKGWIVASIGRSDTTDPLSFRSDITDEAEVQKTVTTIVDSYGPIDACIHAAAVPVDAKTPVLSLPAGSFDEQINIAVRGAFLLAKSAIPHMKEGSAFIGVTSALIEPDVALSRMGSYVTAKYALRGFLRTLASEVSVQKVRVYAVAPGFLPGGLNKGIPEAILKFLGKKSGAGDSTAEEVAEVIGKICTEPTAYVPGSSISVPGTSHPL